MLNQGTKSYAIVGITCIKGLSSDGNTCFLFSHVGKVLRNLIPVHNIPPVRDIFGATVLILEVVSMFPNINAENGEHNLIGNSLHERIVLVGCSHKFQPIRRDANPHPSRTEERTRRGACLEGSLHLIQRSKGFVNRRLEFRAGLRLGGFIGRRHLVPEEGVVVMSSSTVTDAGSGLKSVELKLEDVHLVLTFHGLVDVGNVCSVVFVVMDLHGGCVDVGFEGLEGVFQVWDGVGIGGRRCRDGGGNGSAFLQDFSA
mmetsp:Transcript_4149/g.5400  ORF Transcript_4149/g.5400 Transcript_4149/m.5400 type:complete len:257 (-) Transcript_4149:13-783(-)